MGQRATRRFPLRIPIALLRLLFTRTLREKPCSHLNLIQQTKLIVDVCADCVARGDSWPDLRMCLVCGYVGCCDASKNKHAHKHFEETGHPLVRATAPGDNWLWCYIDNALIAREW